MDAPLETPMLLLRYDGAERRLSRSPYDGAERRVLDPSTEQDHPELCEPQAAALE